MFFWNSLALYDPMNVGNFISCSSAFSKPSLDIWKFLVPIMLKPSMQDFKHDLTSMGGFPDSSIGKESACIAGDLGSIPGSGEGIGYPLQYSGLENFMDCIVHGVAKSQTWLSNFHFHFTSRGDECSCLMVNIFFGTTLLGNWDEAWLFQFCGHCWVFQICWYIECNTLTASSFRVLNSSTEILSHQIALLTTVLPKAHLTSHSRMSGSGWLTTPSQLSSSLKSLLYSSSMYSFHLLLISSASTRSLPFLSFIVAIFGQNVPLILPIFLKGSLVFPLLLFSSTFMHRSLKKVFLSLPATVELCV